MKKALYFSFCIVNLTSELKEKTIFGLLTCNNIKAAESPIDHCIGENEKLVSIFLI